jgi:hypothetical protein
MKAQIPSLSGSGPAITARDVGRHPQCIRAVPSGLVEDQDDVLVLADRGGEPIEELLHRLGVGGSEGSARQACAISASRSLTSSPSFTKAFAGGFAGKIAAPILLAACTILGVGPDACVRFVMGSELSPWIARAILLVLALAATFALIPANTRSALFALPATLARWVRTHRLRVPWEPNVAVANNQHAIATAPRRSPRGPLSDEKRQFRSDLRKLVRRLARAESPRRAGSGCRSKGRGTDI